ncbi:MAG: hypothetical protein JNM21_17135 [Taibaiella sp.]|nr:hypothetical protein [Taibaiella sp.]
MNKRIKLIPLILIWTLNFSCAQQESADHEPGKTERVATSEADTLKFTSAISAIFQDSKGNYWLGSKEGVAVYNGNSFTYFTTNEGLPDNQILSIQEDQNGIIWLAAQNGISSYNGKSLQDETRAITESSRADWEQSDNDLWFAAGIKEGVYRYDGNTLNYLAFPKPKVINPNNLYAVTSIAKGLNNMVWLGTYAGVFGYNGKEFKIINDETIGLDVEVAPLHIRSLFEDAKGRLWIGNNGIGVLLKEGDSIINFSEKNNLIHPASKRKGGPSMPGTLEHVFAIAEDEEGNIWFGDRDAGIWKYDGVKLTNYTKKDGLTNDFALSIFKDNNGLLWFGMADGSIYQFNGKAFEKKF